MQMIYYHYQLPRKLFGLFETPVCWKKKEKKEETTIRRLLKSFEKELKNDIFEQCHSAEKCKRGTLWEFLTSNLLQISKQMKGPFDAIPKFSKSLIVPKKSKWKR